MKVLIVGSGGREHALAWKLSQSPEITQLYAVPGNPGMALHARCLGQTDPFAAANSIAPDLTIIGPEAPLAAGLADRLAARGWAVVGPSAAAARLETSKAFAKEFFRRSGIPTASFQIAETAAAAMEAVRRFGFPVVLKADGLAAGKGVVIARSETEAEQGIAQLAAYSSAVVVEEFLTGEEVSFIVLSDGRRYLMLEPTQDHKTLSDNDTGPNTGGMGAYCDGRILSPAQEQGILDTVISPAIERMAADGNPFVGFLYAGLMMTGAGPKVLEFNVRLGDPETQVLLHRMASDFAPFLIAAANGQLEPRQAISWRADPSVCVVLAAAGYPGHTETGDLIQGLPSIQHAVVFQAGTALYKSDLLTAGGRVLGVTASGPNLPAAIDTSYRAVEKIHFRGMQFRRDIGAKGLARWRDNG